MIIMHSDDMNIHDRQTAAKRGSSRPTLWLRGRCFGVILPLLAAATVSQAATVTLMPVVAERILSLSPTAVADDTLIAVYNHPEENNVQRGIAFFDLSPLPVGSAILSATLGLTIASGSQQPGQQTEVYRLTSAWIPSQAS
jgi:hypothetical protein